ncbi:MAG: DUF2752 domain-containing protein [bacterium]|jgi:hypothetical protein|nr:DUF2752 domain-containing protein [candidate division KSB1 bacterium]MDH7560509.1 DUF2752 domain-containing protein [bacterium]
MRVHIEERRPRQPYLGLIYGGLVIAGLMALRLLRPLLQLASPCAFHSLTGVPCPSCGATRGAVFLANGRIADSLRVNPLFFVLYVALIFWGLGAMGLMLSRRSITVTLSKWEKRLLRIGLVCGIIANWLYLILSHATEHFSM